MDYERTGRTLGTAARVLGRMARQKIDAAAEATPRSPAAPNAAAVPVGQRLQAAREGGKRFREATVKPLAKAGHVLWLEVTGLFFGIFALGFADYVWKVRASWRTGPEHLHFVEGAAATAVFVYFCASSFFRARRRQRR